MKRILLLMLAVVLTACTSMSNQTPLPPLSDNSGAVTFDIAPSAIVTKNSQFNIPTRSDFTVSIDSLRSDNDLKNFFTGEFDNLEKYMVLFGGNYIASAKSGDNEPFTTEKPTFIAKSDFEVFAQRSVAVEMTAVMESYAVEVVYSEELLEAFGELYVEATIGDDSYTFGVGASQIAYLDPSEVTLTLHGTTNQGKPYDAVIKNIASQGREHYILNLTLRPMGNEFAIDVDTDIISFNIDETLDEELYPEIGKAKIGAMQFYETADLVADYNANSVVTVAARVETEALTIQFTDSQFQRYGIDSQRVYDFSVADDVEALRALGLVIPQEGMIGNNNREFSLGTMPEMLETIGGEITNYSVQIIAQGKFQNGKDVTDFNITVNPPVFEMPAINRADIWSKQITYNKLVASNVSNGNLATMSSREELVYQYSYDKSNWVSFANSVLTLTNIAQSTSGKKVYFRALYRGIPSSNVVEATTEGTVQIPNNNFTTNHSTSNNGQPCYWFFANGAAAANQWWATRNSKTTSEGINAQYTRYSGSRPNSGGGIELVTCGWGNANTAAGSWSMIYNVWAAKVFLGTYTTETYDNGDNEHHGKEFNSRPTGVAFQYTYDYYKSGDKYVAEIWAENRTGGVTTKLGYAKASDGTEKSSWTKKTIELEYSNTTLPITHLCVSFCSGIYDNPSDNENKARYVKDPSFASNQPSRGSVFKVKDVTLIYGK